jgi:phage shock protein E
MRSLPALLFILSVTTPSFAESRSAIVNPAIDMPGYLKVSLDAAGHRESRRLSEDEFLKMSGEVGTVVLDARSRDKYDELHIEGAISLPFSDIAIQSLADLLPDRNTRILIYCNNNFENDERAFAKKIASASLNLATYIALYNYGYRNVYELGPQLDVKTTKLRLVPIRALSH